MSTTSPTVRRRQPPALTMNHLSDGSGGRVLDTLHPVTTFHGSEVVAGSLSTRKAFTRIVEAVGEIIAKVAPDVSIGAEVNGALPEIGRAIESDVGMSLTQANEVRLTLNGYIETAAHLTALYAAQKGVSVPYRNHVSGDFMVADGKLRAFTPADEAPARPSVGLAEMNEALARWADCIATIAAVVNAAPDVTAPDGASTAE